MKRLFPILTNITIKCCKDKHTLYLARSLKTRKSFLTLWDKLKDFSLPYDTGKS